MADKTSNRWTNISGIIMEGKIGKYIFQHDPVLDKICVYEKPASEQPEFLISVSPDLTEKDFHYEIMDWYAKNNSQ